MILYTTEYLINSYKYGHGNLVIDGIFLTKGCYGCYFPLLNEVKSLFRKEKIPIHILETRSGEDRELYKNGVWLDDLYIAWQKQNTHHTRHYNMKSNRIDHFFNNSLTKALYLFPNTDYVLYLEDDVAFYKDGFQKIAKIIDNYENGNCKYG